MTSLFSFTVSVRNLIPQLSEIQEVIMFKDLGRVSFYSHLLPFPKQTHWNKVSTCVCVCVGVRGSLEIQKLPLVVFVKADYT